MSNIILSSLRCENRLSINLLISFATFSLIVEDLD